MGEFRGNVNTNYGDYDFHKLRHGAGYLYALLTMLPNISKNICGMYTSAHHSASRKSSVLPYANCRSMVDRQLACCSILTYETASRLNTAEIFNRYRSSIGEELL